MVRLGQQICFLFVAGEGVEALESAGAGPAPKPNGPVAAAAAIGFQLQPPDPEDAAAGAPNAAAGVDGKFFGRKNFFARDRHGAMDPANNKRVLRESAASAVKAPNSKMIEESKTISIVQARSRFTAFMDEKLGEDAIRHLLASCSDKSYNLSADDPNDGGGWGG
jgi:hypothetical protein